MANKRILSVPQNGTQPAVMPTPMDNMLSQSGHTVAKQPSNKRPTSFHLDQNLIKRFKAVCVSQGRNMTNVIEELISQYLDKG